MMRNHRANGYRKCYRSRMEESSSHTGTRLQTMFQQRVKKLTRYWAYNKASMYVFKQCSYIIFFQASVTDLLLASDCSTSAKILSLVSGNEPMSPSSTNFLKKLLGKCRPTFS